MHICAYHPSTEVCRHVTVDGGCGEAGREDVSAALANSSSLKVGAVSGCTVEKQHLYKPTSIGVTIVENERSMLYKLISFIYIYISVSIVAL